MKKFGTSAFITVMALVCYAGFVSAQVASFDTAGDLSSTVKELKAGAFGGPGGHNGPGGHGGPGGGHNVPPPPPPSFGGHGGDHNGPGNHGGNDWNHNNPGNHGGNHPGPQPQPWHPGPQPQPWHPGPQPQPWHPGPQPWNPGPQPQPWHPGPQPWNPGPQPQPWHPGPQPTPWHPHHNGHPNWDNNDWNNNHWNNHGVNPWWNNYDMWWNNNSHPFSLYRTVCTVTPGMSAKGYIVERTMPFFGKATFYYYDTFDGLIGASNGANGVYTGGNGTPVFDFYQVPQRADSCFLAITLQ